uniref:uncharacterized protein LOC128930050 n=1 Tax=Callithrix jacchus TaxID=9483 RepID=UPI0023DCF68A|nr:uncharacterized protein LOC128930050 [Callithrix jacchus]
MAFHFLESRKRQTGTKFSGAEILPDLNPGSGFGGDCQHRKVSLCGGHSDPGTMVPQGGWRGPATALCLATAAKLLSRDLSAGSSPHLPRRLIASQCWGSKVEEKRPRRGAVAGTTRSSYKCEKMALAQLPRASELCRAGSAQSRRGLSRLRNL